MLPTLYHYTCDCGASRIRDDGFVRPFTGFAWFTDLDVPHREALGLTSNLLSCDRTAFAFVVTTNGRDRAVDVDPPVAHQRPLTGIRAGRHAEALVRLPNTGARRGGVPVRTFTPDSVGPDGTRTIHVQRCCNGCGRALGDITNAEIHLVVTGGGLPDARRECPTCNPRPLVGPVRTVSFGGGPRWRHGSPPRWWPQPSVNYDVPANTGDPRYVACLDHHVACDCREAELAEVIGELRYALRDFEKACDEILAGHPTGSSYDPDTTNCQCTGCRIARAAHYYQKGSRS